MRLENLSVLEIVDLIKSKKISCLELTEYYLGQIEKYKDKNAVLEVFDDATTNAKKIDEYIASNDNLPSLIGVPILIKDNLMYDGKICSCASKMLEHYVAQYNATVIQKLLDAGVVILGRTNMDEFAMGSSCENSAFGNCKNAHDDSKVPGGSSGGSAVAVALDMCAFALGSDTGGSVRQPASYNGVVGLKPTYARISRYGLVPYASSLDTVGIFSKNVKDNAYILSIIAGRDKNDDTSSRLPVDDYLSHIYNSISGKKIAVIKEVKEQMEKTPYLDIYNSIYDLCRESGAEIIEVSIPEYSAILSAYYTIAFAEVTSNLGRLDGVRYTSRSEDVKDIDSLFINSRTEFFGKEVKRRIMLGNFVLSSEYYNAYYVKAKQIAQKLKEQFSEVFESCDLIFMPTAYGEAFDLGAKTNDPLSMYIEDMFTVPINVVGVPAISIPCGKGVNGLPLGLQILAKHFNEKEIYNMADFIISKRGQ